MSAFVIIFVLALFFCLVMHIGLVALVVFSIFAIAALAYFQICCLFCHPAIVVLSFFHCCCTGLLSHLLSLLISPLLNSSFLMNGLTLSSLHFLLLLHYNVFATPSYLLRLGTSLASLTEVQNRERSN